MRKIATERGDLGDASIARGLDITALYAQHASDGYELYGRYSNNQLARMLKAVGFDVSAFAAAKGSISTTGKARGILIF
jgi:hypothetical protein